MRHILPFIIIPLVALSSCSDDDAAVVFTGTPPRASVTLMVTLNSLGDNGYNDCAAEGVFAFAGETGTPLSLLRPDDEAEAVDMYRRWLTDNADRDSAVLIVGSSAYARIVEQCAPSLSGRGSRVLLFESDAAIEGATTLMINRYGVSYLAAAMSEDFNVLIMAAAEGYATLDTAIRGFSDGRTIHSGVYDGVPCDTELYYLAAGEEGFSMPDSAYHYIARRAREWNLYSEMIFPLLGGSQLGVISYLNDDDYTGALLVGMDTDMAGQCARVPFSVEIRIGDVLKRMLYDWRDGEDWPARYCPGMGEGAADIVITPSFKDNIDIWDSRYANPDEFRLRYDKYREEAITKESEYGK